MPRTSERGGPRTRARILEVANRLFMENGYDAVTVAQVAREAGVSSVTVFNHFPRKEDLFLDRAGDVLDLLHRAVADREPGSAVVDSLEAAALALIDDGNALTGYQERSLGFLRTVAASAALQARARAIRGELEVALRDELVADPAFDGDARLVAALVVAGYATLFVENASRLLDGEPSSDVAADHRLRLSRLFDALRHGLADGA
ncbi:TetR/AcrR family transcriptional regulator [Frondihabitans australicus]|uniref:TetR family transcriptional regulator n=1 Tax=Frondihabitans australicus TaxID=386892 RepID=A0A495IDC0_9MICO|nr:TetR/AcrR family transcriptional regulator [Frondihabitans australicus]RKR74003.1 TetR family transcriptional regulator [Frondihabitans australicus]